MRMGRTDGTIGVRASDIHAHHRAQPAKFGAALEIPLFFKVSLVDPVVCNDTVSEFTSVVQGLPARNVSADLV